MINGEVGINIVTTTNINLREKKDAWAGDRTRDSATAELPGLAEVSGAAESWDKISLQVSAGWSCLNLSSKTSKKRHLALTELKVFADDK